jgi:hypothetical protein
MVEHCPNPVEQFPKGDARRLFILLAAIDHMERPTLTSLSSYTGHNKGTIDADVARLSQFGVSIVKIDAVYRVAEWGDLLVRESVLRFLPKQ